MKKLVSQLKEHTDYLNNLTEKNHMEYIDAPFKCRKITKTLESVAEDLAQKAVDYDYPSDEAFHPFLYCDKNLSKKLGFDNISICPYVGNIHNVWLLSNFMWQKYENNNSLIIDIYYIGKTKDKDYIKNLIFQELFNFKRDAKWVVDGVYEEKMQEMVKNIEKEIL